MKSAKATETGKARKGAKTEAILRYLEKHGEVAPAVIAPAIKLCAKEVSSRLSMLVAQGRVKREEDDDGVVLVSFVSWQINRIEDADAEPPPTWEVPELERHYPTAVHDHWLGQQLMAVANAATTSPSEASTAHGAPAAPSSLLGLLDPSLVTPFTQVMLRAVSEGRVRVTTHCLADTEPRRRMTLIPNAATQAAAAAAMAEAAAAEAAAAAAPAVKPARAPQVLDRVDDVTTFAFDVLPPERAPRSVRRPRATRPPASDERQAAQFALF